MKRLPPLRTLKSFEAAARNGSFQKASEELFVTPSAISHQIKALELFLGLELFRRHKRRVELTSAGKEYLQSVQIAFKELERSTQKLISAHTSGELTLAVAPAFLTRWLLPRIGHFNEQYPDIESHLLSHNGLVDFDRDNIDMAVYFGHGDWPGVETHFLKRSELIPVCHPDLLAEKPINKPEDLTQFPLLHVVKRKDEWRSWFEEAGAEYKESKKGLYLSSGLLTADAATKGLGIALADVNLISDEINSGQLVVALDIPLPLSKSFYLVYQKNRAATYSMMVFREWIMQEMSKDALSK
ncbi:MAG: transcriptional regulator GcvA [Gammaproteobacteria bacterium]|nr:transcriptional regulator GcvA [Gammaproteobacteria bacterium]